MFSAQAIQRIAVSFVPLLLGVICHEVAHGYVAWRLGDPTAKSAGRLTLNPIKHLDAAGSFVFLLTALFSSFVIGWAKPVPIDPRYFKNKRLGMVLVSLAGPLTNILLAALFALGLKLMLEFGDPRPSAGAMLVYKPLANICQAGMIINVALACLNLLPLPPLDGSKIVAGLLPPRLAYEYLRLERYGFLALILLLATGMLDKVLFPCINFGYDALIAVFGLA